MTESWVGLGIEAKWRVVRITCVRRGKQSPISLTHASLHEEVVDPSNFLDCYGAEVVDCGGVGGEGGTFFFLLRDLLKVLVKWNIF